jgi:fumarate reductase flavoprotein subunit
MKAAFIAIILFTLFALVYASEKRADEVDPAHAAQELNCADCHDTDKPEKRAPASKCIECHSSKTDEPPIAFKDETDISYNVNPHASHAGNMRCTLCHKIHAPSSLYCNEGCHHKFLLKVP